MDSEGPDQTAHLRSLILAFAARKFDKVHFLVKRFLYISLDMTNADYSPFPLIFMRFDLFLFLILDITWRFTIDGRICMHFHLLFSMCFFPYNTVRISKLELCTPIFAENGVIKRSHANREQVAENGVIKRSHANREQVSLHKRPGWFRFRVC